MVTIARAKAARRNIYLAARRVFGAEAGTCDDCVREGQTVTNTPRASRRSTWRYECDGREHRARGATASASGRADAGRLRVHVIPDHIEVRPLLMAGRSPAVVQVKNIVDHLEAVW
jgi:hypothetical protein